MMTREERPYCFAKIDCVFPMGGEGLRETPANCQVCYCKTECLRTALQGEEGAQIQDETLDRAYAAGMMGFFERWSRKKALHRRKAKS
jgi:hypothetical protein